MQASFPTWVSWFAMVIFFSVPAAVFWSLRSSARAPKDIPAISDLDASLDPWIPDDSTLAEQSFGMAIAQADAGITNPNRAA